MKILKVKYTIVLIFLLFNLGRSIALAEKNTVSKNAISLRKIDRQTWKETIKELDYTKKTKEKVIEKQSSGRSFNFDFLSGWGNVAKFLLFAGVLLLLGLVIYFLYKKTIHQRNQKVSNNKIALENIEDNIQESDLDKFLRQALESADYRLAVRIFYLKILKLLAEKKLIEWKKNKANFTYLIEMKKNLHFDTFNNLTMVFEKIWYGDKNINKDEYEFLAIEFNAYQKVILDKIAQ